MAKSSKLIRRSVSASYRARRFINLGAVVDVAVLIVPVLVAALVLGLSAQAR